MSEIIIYNENCFDTMSRLTSNTIDLILTSPPYNTNRRAGLNRNLLNDKSKGYTELRYDSAVDTLTDEEYCDFTKNLFIGFDKILKSNGCVLYNISYGSENTEGMFLAINSILVNTPFTIADTIIWKKKSALPNNVSSNKLTRICEFVFVFCRKSEFNSFYCNKQIKSYMPSGQPVYENILNFVEAPNNDGICPYNKATYSTELCNWLLSIYAPPIDTKVYDPFMGSGTTAISCKQNGFDCIGSEISELQCKFANERLEHMQILTTKTKYKRTALKLF